MRMNRMACLLLLIPPVSGGTCGTNAPNPTNVSFANQVLPIFASNCVGCHGAGALPPNLTNAGAFAAIVNQASLERPDLNHVSPGSAGTSWLFIKVNSADPGTGLRMPTPPLPALSAADISTIQNWINQGALNN